MPYVGWKIWAYPFDPEGGRLRPTVEEIRAVFADRFAAPNWLLDMNKNRIELTHRPTQTQIGGIIAEHEVTVHIPPRVSYYWARSDAHWLRGGVFAITLRSMFPRDLRMNEQAEKKHRMLLATIIRTLPWMKLAVRFYDQEQRVVHWNGPIREEKGLRATESHYFAGLPVRHESPRRLLS